MAVSSRAAERLQQAFFDNVSWRSEYWISVAAGTNHMIAFQDGPNLFLTEILTFRLTGIYMRIMMMDEGANTK
jgi:hypothetical protein